jgi:protease I
MTEIAAVCHGPQIPTAADAVRGRKVSARRAVALELRAAGGELAEIAIDARWSTATRISV